METVSLSFYERVSRDIPLSGLKDNRGCERFLILNPDRKMVLSNAVTLPQEEQTEGRADDRSVLVIPFQSRNTQP